MDSEKLVDSIVGKLDKLGHLPDLLLKVGLAYAGYQSTKHWTGALTALIGLKLAESRNLAAGAAGVTTLGLIGLGNAFRPKYNPATGLTHEQWCELSKIQGYDPPSCP